MYKRLTLIFLTILSVLPARMMAQWTFDIVSVEAYINDHKQQRSLLLARSTLEQSNKLLHDYTKDAVGDYKQINVELDKYTRAFDVIDVLYQGLRTALNAKDTYNTVSDRIGDYKDMISEYNQKVVRRGKVSAADTIIITISLRAVENIYEESTQLYSSFTDLLLYATGAAACSTADLMVILESINTSMDNIEKTLNTSYFETWRYLQVRMGFWKEELYRTKTKDEILDEAFKRWRTAGHLDY